jgi:hypothetical protein
MSSLLFFMLESNIRWKSFKVTAEADAKFEKIQITLEEVAEPEVTV